MPILTVMLAAAAPAVASTADPLAELAHALAGAPAWEAGFTQEYLPAGFEDGTSESGTVIVASPDRLRFTYEGFSPRIFASDGVVVRLVDVEGETCDAMLLDQATWGRLPLAAMMDPGASAHHFRVTPEVGGFTLTPVDADPDVETIRIIVGADSLPTELVILDPQGNRNSFSFAAWRRTRDPGPEFFRPSLTGQRPCLPEGR